jgi:hypothetical protein
MPIWTTQVTTAIGLSVELAKSNRKLPIPEADVRFPYYGQALYDLVHDAPPDEVAEIIVKGSKDEARRAFTELILNEVRRKLGVTDEEVIDIAGGDVVQKGLQNKTWVLAILRAIDKHVPGGSGATIASVTNDVYQYIRNPGVRDRIDEGVRKAFSGNDANVVVSHSLGTIVAYGTDRPGRKGGELASAVFYDAWLAAGDHDDQGRLKPIGAGRHDCPWHFPAWSVAATAAQFTRAVDGSARPAGRRGRAVAGTGLAIRSARLV